MGTWILLLAAVLSFLSVFLGAVWIGGFFDRWFRPEEPDECSDKETEVKNTSNNTPAL